MNFDTVYEFSKQTHTQYANQISITVSKNPISYTITVFSLNSYTVTRAESDNRGNHQTLYIKLFNKWFFLIPSEIFYVIIVILLFIINYCYFCYNFTINNAVRSRTTESCPICPCSSQIPKYYGMRVRGECSVKKNLKILSFFFYLRFFFAFLMWETSVKIALCAVFFHFMNIMCLAEINAASCITKLVQINKLEWNFQL